MVVSRHQERVVAVVVMVMLPVTVLADRVFWGCNYGEPQVHRSGPIACRQEVRQCYNMILSCSRGDESLFTVNDFADYIAASADGRYIVGLSNRGSENAFWIRDSRGIMIQRKTHDSGLHYCQQSVTNVREWFDKAEPAVTFQFADGKLMQVVVRSCDGKDLLLLE